MKKETKPEEKKPIDFAKLLVIPHENVSVEVKDKDIKRVMKDAHDMYNLCFTMVGIYGGFLAIAHPQISDKKPLRFFVTKDAELIINPVMVRHTKTTIDSSEGCATFSELPPIITQRWNKCEVEYQTIIEGEKLSNTIFEKLSGIRAKMFQHEIDHLDSEYIYEYKND